MSYTGREYLPSALGRSLEAALANLDASRSILLNDVISEDPQRFYGQLGPLSHSATRKLVTILSDYQPNTWKGLLEHKRVLVVKSHKIGRSTSFLMGDLQLCLLASSHPMSSKGYDTIILAQTKQLALSTFAPYER